MDKREPRSDLDKYLPDEATADAVMNGSVEYNRNVDPKLLERLAELKLRTSSPDVLREAPPSVAVYVPPTVVQPAGAEGASLPRTEPKVELDLPPAASEYPTQPSLKRLEGEPEVPGVVNGARGRARKKVLVSPHPVSARGAAFAVLAVLAPLILVITLMGRATRTTEHRGAVSATSMATASEPASKPSAAPSTAASVAPTAAATTAPAPSATASAAVSAVPTGVAPKPRGRSAAEDPYDAATPAPPATATPSATPTPQVTAESSAAPPPTKSAPPPYVEERPEF